MQNTIMHHAKSKDRRHLAKATHTRSNKSHPVNRTASNDCLPYEKKVISSW
jgi:hypothetical protein